MKLSVVSHFYNNRSSLKAMLASFRHMDEVAPSAFDFVLVDDHSHEPIEPRLYRDVRNLRVFRILDDVPWNMPAARNIGVHEALCDKVLLVDIDHIVEPTQIEALLANADSLPLGSTGHFRRMKVQPEGEREEMISHMNSFIIHKADFNRVGGYEELFSGHYGSEDKFFKNCCKRNGIKDIMFDTMLLVRGAATKGLDRDKSVNMAIIDRLLGEGASKASKSLSFRWERIFPE